MHFFSPQATDEGVLIEKLYKQHSKLLASCAYGILHDYQLAENAVQETFRKIIGKAHKLQAVDDIRTRSYLLTICANEAKKIYNKRKKQVTVDINLLQNELAAGSQSDPLFVLIGNDSAQRIADIILGLNEIYREVLVLKYFHKHSNTEICGLLDISQDAMKKRLYRAKEILASGLTQEELK